MDFITSVLNKIGEKLAGDEDIPVVYFCCTPDNTPEEAVKAAVAKARASGSSIAFVSPFSEGRETEPWTYATSFLWKSAKN